MGPGRSIRNVTWERNPPVTRSNKFPGYQVRKSQVSPRLLTSGQPKDLSICSATTQNKKKISVSQLQWIRAASIKELPKYELLISDVWPVGAILIFWDLKQHIYFTSESAS